MFGRWEVIYLLLLALARAAHRGGGAAAASAVLDLFALDPTLACHELASAAFEALFAPRLLPDMRHFAARRASAAAAKAKDEEGGGSNKATAVSAMQALSLMSGAQAQEMWALEREYYKMRGSEAEAAVPGLPPGVWRRLRLRGGDDGGAVGVDERSAL